MYIGCPVVNAQRNDLILLSEIFEAWGPDVVRLWTMCIVLFDQILICEPLGANHTVFLR